MARFLSVGEMLHRLFLIAFLGLAQVNPAYSNDDFEYAKTLLAKGDEQQAASIFLECAVAGHCGCMNVIATLFYTGQGVERDFVFSVYWHERAYQTGTLCGLAGAYSAAALGHMLAEGDGLKQDSHQAQNWYERALILARKHNGTTNSGSDESKALIRQLELDLKQLEIKD